MPNIQFLDRVIHRTVRVHEEKALSVGRDTTMCLVTFNEIFRLVLEYPIVFTKDGDSGQYVCVALFGVDPGENLFWRDGRWNAEYLPLNIARQPFSLDVTGDDGAVEGSAKLVTCIDVENPGVQSTEGQRLFDDGGKETPYLVYKQGLLAELASGEIRSNQFVQRMVQLDLVRPIQLELKGPGLDPRKITGLYSIDELKMRSLADGVLTVLNASGHLRAAFAMLSSLGHLQIQAQRAARWREAARAAKEKAPSLS